MTGLDFDSEMIPEISHPRGLPLFLFWGRIQSPKFLSWGFFSTLSASHKYFAREHHGSLTPPASPLTSIVTTSTEFLPLVNTLGPGNFPGYKASPPATHPLWSLISLLFYMLSHHALIFNLSLSVGFLLSV